MKQKADTETKRTPAKHAPAKQSKSTASSGARKKRASTKQPKRGAEEQALLDELLTLLPLLDEECLAALVQSARNLASSLEEERNRESEYERFQQAVYETFKPKPSTKSKKNAKKTSAAKGGKTEAGLAIESTEDGRFFNIVIGGKWKLFNMEEMTALAKIALVKESIPEVCPRVYAWLKRERSDMLSDFAIADGTSVRIRELVSAIRKKFKVIKK